MSERRSTRVVIPKGAISENESAIIEIPDDVRDSPLLYVSPPKHRGSFRK